MVTSVFRVQPLRRLVRLKSLAAAAILATLGSTSPAAANEFTINACQADRANFSTQAFEDFATRGMIARADHVVLVTTPEEMTANLVIDALDHLETPATVVVNKAHPRAAAELRAIDECLALRGLHRSVPIPHDGRLATMLGSGTYAVEALDRRTRLPVKRLGLAVADRMV
jgi:hypothetical protein